MRWLALATYSDLALPFGAPAPADAGRRPEHGAGEEQAEASACGAPQLPHATHQVVAQTRPSVAAATAPRRGEPRRWWASRNWNAPLAWAAAFLDELGQSK